MRSTLIHSLLALAAGLPALAQYSKQPTFFSCATQAYHDNLGDSLPENVPLPQSATECANACYTIGNAPYSSYIQDITSCVCTSRAPLNGEYITGNPGKCLDVVNDIYYPEVMITHTSFSILTEPSCSFGYKLGEGFKMGIESSDTDIMNIFQRCAGFETVNIYADFAASYQFNCGTGPLIYDNPKTCGAGTDHHYRHSPEAAASLFTRKRKREQLALAASKPKSDCPAGLTPCQASEVPGTGFECIDTNVELESCGGCVYGLYSHMGHTYNTTVAATGQNCGDIPNARFGTASCRVGQCEFQCNKGYQRKGDACVRGRGIKRR